MHIRPCAAYFKTTLCGISWVWSLGLCRNIPAQSCVIMWSHWSQQNEAQKQTRNFYNLLLTVQFNVPQKCYEFKPNTELLKTSVNAMNTLYYVISHEIVVWIFCCQKIWITQVSNLEITPKNYGNTEQAMQKLSKCPWSTQMSICLKLTPNSQLARAPTYTQPDSLSSQERVQQL